jgi:hypothetical protein
MRGINLGNWLVPEGYMWGTSGFANSPTEIANVISSLIGQENTRDFFRRYRNKYIIRKDIDQIARWGFNSIRLPMHFELFTPRDTPFVYSEEGFALIDSLLSWCEANRLYLIFDLHCAPGGQNEGNISDYAGYPSLWEDTLAQSRTVDLWRVIAQRYSDKNWIGGYDLLNETAFDFTGKLGQPNNQPLRVLLGRITDAIRRVDANHIVFIEGNWYATDFNGLTPPWDKNLVYSFHKYWNSTDQGSVNYLINLRTNYQRPLWLGESGENSNDWFAECINRMESNGIGWAWWPWKKMESASGLLSIVNTPEYTTLLQYWSGQGLKPTVAFAIDALNGMADRCLIDSCRFNEEVVDALMRQPHTNATLPYANITLPGTIYAVNHDIGRNGYAYHDSISQNTSGSAGAAWNNGWSYRNNGVDIERCTDSTTNGYNVGWIDPNEFLNYTVRVTSTGRYNVRVRIAANASGGKFLLVWDAAQHLDTVRVPLTGGWQKWQTVESGSVDLAAGTHTLSIRFLSGGYNLNYIQFIAKDSPGEQPVKNNLIIFQNFPNPFALKTTIAYEVLQEGMVIGRLNDVVGREIAIFVNGVMTPGRHETTLDSDELGLASGVYFYQLSWNGQTSKRMKVVFVK